MNESHFIRNTLLVIVGVIAVGFVAWWLIKILLGLLFYVIVGALVVGGAYYLVRRSRSISGRNRRSIKR